MPLPHYFGFDVGGALLSHTLSSAVPSALEGLASGFGMGPGVPRSATTTDNTIQLNQPNRTSHPGRRCRHDVPTPLTGKSLWLCAQGHTVDANNTLRK